MVLVVDSGWCIINQVRKEGGAMGASARPHPASLGSPLIVAKQSQTGIKGNSILFMILWVEGPLFVDLHDIV